MLDGMGEYPVTSIQYLCTKISWKKFVKKIDFYNVIAYYVYYKLLKYFIKNK